MQCGQIQQYLEQYADGSLPGYKAAWVVQHLAGCPECTAAAEEAGRSRQRPVREPAPVRPAVQVQAAATAEREQQFQAVQRPVPPWLRWVTALLLMAAAGGAVWLFSANGVPSQRLEPAWVKHG